MGRSDSARLSSRPSSRSPSPPASRARTAPGRSRHAINRSMSKPRASSSPTTPNGSLNAHRVPWGAGSGVQPASGGQRRRRKARPSSSPPKRSHSASCLQSRRSRRRLSPVSRARSRNVAQSGPAPLAEKPSVTFFQVLHGAPQLQPAGPGMIVTESPLLHGDMDVLGLGPAPNLPDVRNTAAFRDEFPWSSVEELNKDGGDPASGGHEGADSEPHGHSNPRSMRHTQSSPAALQPASKSQPDTEELMGAFLHSSSISEMPPHVRRFLQSSYVILGPQEDEPPLVLPPGVAGDPVTLAPAAHTYGTLSESSFVRALRDYTEVRPPGFDPPVQPGARFVPRHKRAASAPSHHTELNEAHNRALLPPTMPGASSGAPGSLPQAHVLQWHSLEGISLASSSDSASTSGLHPHQLREAPPQVSAGFRSVPLAQAPRGAEQPPPDEALQVDVVAQRGREGSPVPALDLASSARRRSGQLDAPRDGTIAVARGQVSAPHSMSELESGGVNGDQGPGSESWLPQLEGADAQGAPAHQPPHRKRRRKRRKRKKKKKAATKSTGVVLTTVFDFIDNDDWLQAGRKHKKAPHKRHRRHKSHQRRAAPRNRPRPHAAGANRHDDQHHEGRQTMGQAPPPPSHAPPPPPLHAPQPYQVSTRSSVDSSASSFDAALGLTVIAEAEELLAEDEPSPLSNAGSEFWTHTDSDEGSRTPHRDRRRESDGVVEANPEPHVLSPTNEHAFAAPTPPSDGTARASQQAPVTATPTPTVTSNEGRGDAKASAGHSNVTPMTQHIERVLDDGVHGVVSSHLFADTPPPANARLALRPTAAGHGVVGVVPTSPGVPPKHRARSRSDATAQLPSFGLTEASRRHSSTSVLGPGTRVHVPGDTSVGHVRRVRPDGTVDVWFADAQRSMSIGRDMVVVEDEDQPVAVGQVANVDSSDEEGCHNSWGRMQASPSDDADCTATNVQELDENPNSGAPEDEAAAVRIQSIIRGKQARAEVAAKRQSQVEPVCSDVNEDEFDTPEDEAAAVRIQSIIRGKQARAEVAAKRQSQVKPANSDFKEDEFDTPEDEAAAVRIQSIIRGKQARAEVAAKRAAAVHAGPASASATAPVGEDTQQHSPAALHGRIIANGVVYQVTLRLLGELSKVHGTVRFERDPIAESAQQNGDMEHPRLQNLRCLQLKCMEDIEAQSQPDALFLENDVSGRFEASARTLRLRCRKQSHAASNAGLDQGHSGMPSLISGSTCDSRYLIIKFTDDRLIEGHLLVDEKRLPTSGGSSRSLHSRGAAPSSSSKSPHAEEATAAQKSNDGDMNGGQAEPGGVFAESSFMSTTSGEESMLDGDEEQVVRASEDMPAALHGKILAQGAQWRVTLRLAGGGGSKIAGSARFTRGGDDTPAGDSEDEVFGRVQLTTSSRIAALEAATRAAVGMDHDGRWKVMANIVTGEYNPETRVMRLRTERQKGSQSGEGAKVGEGMFLTSLVPGYLCQRRILSVKYLDAGLTIGELNVEEVGHVPAD